MTTYLRNPALTQILFVRIIGLTTLETQEPAWQLGYRYLCQHVLATVSKVSITLWPQPYGGGLSPSAIIKP